MSLSFLPGHVLATQSPHTDLPKPFPAVQRTAPKAAVGEMPYSSLRREARITHLSAQIKDWVDMAWEFAWDNNAAEFDFCRDEAYRLLHERDALILGRAPEEVAALEEARGLN